MNLPYASENSHFKTKWFHPPYEPRGKVVVERKGIMNVEASLRRSLAEGVSNCG